MRKPRLFLHTFLSNLAGDGFGDTAWISPITSHLLKHLLSKELHPTTKGGSSAPNPGEQTIPQPQRVKATDHTSLQVTGIP